jgi:hypothetical protein
MFEKLECAKAILEDLKGPVLPKLKRRFARLSALKPENQERTRRLIELRCSEPDEEEVRDLNLYTSRLAPYEDLCPAAQKICRRLYGQAAGFFDVRSTGVQHAVIGG